MKRTLVGLVVGTLALGGLQLAGANTKTIEDPDTDATPNSVDIVSATAGHTDDGKLRHIVKVDAPLNDDTTRQILLQFNLDDDRDCEREFIWPPSGHRPMIRCGVGATEKEGTISQPGPKTLKFVFRKGVLGSPDVYRWRVISKECAGKCDTIDAAPDQNGDNQVYVRHRIN
jgi:hypothetical protein